MRESRTYGSGRGARGNSRPYRESCKSLRCMSPVMADFVAKVGCEGCIARPDEARRGCCFRQPTRGGSLTHWDQRLPRNLDATNRTLRARNARSRRRLSSQLRKSMQILRDGCQRELELCTAGAAEAQAA
jgi:hypothetical protein